MKITKTKEEETWWERDLRIQRELFESLKGKSYAELLKTVTFDHAQEYNHPSTEDVFAAFGLDYNWDIHYEVPFLTERASALTWRCTDTQVGLHFIFHINDSGSETPIGIMEQTARRNDKVYSFFSEEWIKVIRAKLITMVEYKERNPPIISLEDVALKTKA